MTTQSIKRKVRVTIIKEIEVELTPAVFGPLTHEQYLEEFRKGLWNVNGMDDVVLYAAHLVAIGGGGCTHDGLGLVGSANSTYPRVPDVKFRELDEEIEEEFIE